MMGKFEELIMAINAIDPNTREKELEKYRGDCSMRNAALENASRVVADYARVSQLVFSGQRSALEARGFDDFDDFVTAYDEAMSEKESVIPLTEEELESDVMEGKPVYCVSKRSGHGEWCLVNSGYIYDSGGIGVRAYIKMQTCDIYSRPPKGEKG